MSCKIPIIVSILCLSSFFSCESDGDILFSLVLQDQYHKTISSFELGDSVLLRCYLINYSNETLEYNDLSCLPFNEFFKVYKRDENHKFHFIGQPKPICALNYNENIVKPHEVKFIGGYCISRNNEYKWPEFEPGIYYVGDVFKITINNKKYEFQQSVYFTILE